MDKNPPYGKRIIFKQWLPPWNTLNIFAWIHWVYDDTSGNYSGIKWVTWFGFRFQVDTRKGMYC